MIVGQVNQFRQAQITVTVHGDDGSPIELTATVDTGFSGFITLSAPLIASLSLAFLEVRTYTLGDGSDVALRLFLATVVWDGTTRIVLAVEAHDEALVGMEMLDGYTLFLEGAIGGHVRIERQT
jgi:clan AA aspartic protease